MTEERNFEEKMSKLSDEELYDVLAHENDYVPEAFDVAKKEFQNRNLSPEKLAELESVAEAKKYEEEEKADKPLPWLIRILMFLFPLGIAQILLSEYYRNIRYKRRSRECWTWMGYGIIFYVVLIIVNSL